jgi:hypothetical protein
MANWKVFKRPVMVKKKTSLMIDEDTWKAFTIFAAQRTGSARKMSEEVEEALKNYMTDPRPYRGSERESYLCWVDLRHARIVLNKKRKEGYSTLVMRMWKQ